MDHKKPDLRDKQAVKTTVTDNNAQMAGEHQQPGLTVPRSDMHVVTPEIGKNLAEGQATKG